MNLKRGVIVQNSVTLSSSDDINVFNFTTSVYKTFLLICLHFLLKKNSSSSKLGD